MATTQATPLVQSAAWKALAAHAAATKTETIANLFATDPGRGTRMTAEAGGIFLDYSKHRASAETLRLLLALAEEIGLQGRIEAMFTGEKINVTEGRAVG